MAVDPPEGSDPCYASRGFLRVAVPREVPADPVPDAFELQDAARLAASSILARMDLARGGQPFFRIYPFASPPRAEHEKWDDADMSGRYVEGLILARRTLRGSPSMRGRRSCAPAWRGSATRRTASRGRGPRRGPRAGRASSASPAPSSASSRGTRQGSAAPRRLLDRLADGLMRIAVPRGDAACFPKYQWDGQAWVDEPQGKDAPAWYGGRDILPLVEYWKLSGRDDVRVFAERLARYSLDVNPTVRADGEISRATEDGGGHLHGTMGMMAGIVELGRLTGRPDWVERGRRVYDWIGRTHTSRCGWVADSVGSSICESCAIAARFRLGLALRRAGALDPFGEIDRHLREPAPREPVRRPRLPRRPSRPRRPGPTGRPSPASTG